MSKTKRRRMWRKIRKLARKAIFTVWNALVRFVAWAEQNGILKPLVQFILKVVFWWITRSVPE